MLEKAALRQTLERHSVGRDLDDEAGAGKPYLQHAIDAPRQILRQDGADSVGAEPAVDPGGGAEARALQLRKDIGAQRQLLLREDVGLTGAAPAGEPGSTADNLCAPAPIVPPGATGPLGRDEDPIRWLGDALPADPDVHQGPADRIKRRGRGPTLLLGAILATGTMATAIGWAVTLPQVQGLLASIAPGHFSAMPAPALKNLPAGQATRALTGQEARTTTLERQLRLAREQIVSLEAVRQAAQTELAQRDAALARARAELQTSVSDAGRLAEYRMGEMRARLETAVRELAGARGELARARAETSDRVQAWSADEHVLRASWRSSGWHSGGNNWWSGATRWRWRKHRPPSPSRFRWLPKPAKRSGRVGGRSSQPGWSCPKAAVMGAWGAAGRSGAQEAADRRVFEARPVAATRLGATGARTPECGSRTTPAEVSPGQVALERLPRMLETPDPNTRMALGRRTASPGAVAQRAPSDPETAAGVDALRAALTAIKHRSESRSEVGAR